MMRKTIRGAAESRTGAMATALLGALLFLAPRFVSAQQPPGQAAPAAAQQAQKKFRTPEEGAKALLAAAKAGDDAQLLAILGPDGKELVASGDPAADRAARENLIRAAGEMMRLVNTDDGVEFLHVGNEDWPLPIPLVKSSKEWRFDTARGKEELLSRVIGRNELTAIGVCRAYVEAQEEYAGEDFDGDQVLEFAQRVASTPGRRDGLYWKAGTDQAPSPLGPLVAQAAAGGSDTPGSGSGPRPYHGYVFRVLKAQGKNAPGGAYGYVINGIMIGGFALVAWPDDYGASGIMTFVVNQLGVVHEKDLGPATGEIAAAMSAYDPDASWKKVE